MLLTIAYGKPVTLRCWVGGGGDAVRGQRHLRVAEELVCCARLLNLALFAPLANRPGSPSIELACETGGRRWWW